MSRFALCLSLWSAFPITSCHPHNGNTTMAPTSAVIAINTLPATNAGNSNLYADTSADSDPSPPSTGGIVLCVAGAILAITSVFILRLYLQWREEQKLKNEPNSLWQRTKTLSISNITSMTRTSITSPNASNTSSNACHMMTTPVSTEIAPDKEQRLTEIWNESEQTVHEIDIDFNDLNGKSPPPLGSHKQSIGYIEAIFASCSAGEEAEESKEVESPRVRDPISPFTSDHDVHPDDRDQSQHSPSNQSSKPNGGDIENESSSTKMADPDPRDDPNWRSPSKKYRITVVSIDDLEEARLDIDGFEEERVGRHDRDEYRHAGPRHMVQVHSQSVSEYAGFRVFDALALVSLDTFTFDASKSITKLLTRFTKQLSQ